jgi:hypothetical protein
MQALLCRKTQLFSTVAGVSVATLISTTSCSFAQDDERSRYNKALAKMRTEYVPVDVTLRHQLHLSFVKYTQGYHNHSNRSMPT